MPGETFVIVGASLAGAKAAETLRSEGFDGRLLLIGSEDERPYERPPLSKQYLRGERESKPYVHAEGFYEEQGIELRTATTVDAIDPAASTVALAGGETLGFDRLLLTTGSEPRRLTLPGADLDGVYLLRTIADCDVLRARIEAGGRLVTIGAGWIGSEVSASAREKGCEVTILERDEVPLERVLGTELGGFYRDVHAEHGVDVMGGVTVEAVEGAASVTAVRLGDGRTIPADFVVVGVGIEPRVGLARDAGLDVDNGVLTDEHLQTSAPAIYAAGDVANAHHPFYGQRIRVEHWDNALHQGPAAARNMLGERAPYDRIPYFFSDQYDVGMEYSGYAREWDDVVFRGDPGSREFLAFWVKGGHVIAGMNVNIWDVHDDIRALIQGRVPVDRAQLADAGTPLSALTVRD